MGTSGSVGSSGTGCARGERPQPRVQPCTPAWPLSVRENSPQIFRPRLASKRSAHSDDGPWTGDAFGVTGVHPLASHAGD